MKKNSSTKTLTVLAMAIGLSACTLPGQTVQSGSMDGEDVTYLRELQIAPELRIKDLPVPAGYRYDPKKSMIIEYSDVKAGIIVYNGPDDPNRLIDFFRREFPSYGWTLTSMIEREVTRMIFDKPDRTTELTITPGGGFGSKTEVTIYYAPK